MTTGGSTLTALSAPAVLAIGCPPDLVARCALAMEGIGVALRTCDFLNAATVAAERRPLALIMLEDLYAFDPDEFDALARDVTASLVRVEDDIAVAKLELVLGAAIDAAAAKRGELLPAWPDVEGRPVLETDDREVGRRTASNQALLEYPIGQRLPSSADLAAVAWPALPAHPGERPRALPAHPGERPRALPAHPGERPRALPAHPGERPRALPDAPPSSRPGTQGGP